ncbi:NDR1/HIN1-Like protein [Actinidia chinensis var. chinensis]|uniref:NDR1/HIN1-Like protein n=1 Tax=Actinidia chinensis var. chinensis TaxID=1590841 RepID=A0A2R6RAZ3_ACTCC|nr:NDR1/HIN1-Like protein [Actinidia chinensis var. chinensis]
MCVASQKISPPDLLTCGITHRLRFHIRDFSVLGLAQANGFKNARVIFNLTVCNANHKIEFYYDAMQVTLYCEDLSIGKTSLLFPFHQEPKNTTVLYGVLSGATLTVNHQRWTEFQRDRRRGVVIFPKNRFWGHQKGTTFSFSLSHNTPLQPLNHVTKPKMTRRVPSPRGSSKLYWSSVCLSSSMAKPDTEKT